MGLVKNGFIDLGNGFFINNDLVESIVGEVITLKNGESYYKNELTLPEFLLNGNYCFNLFDSKREIDRWGNESERIYRKK